MGFCYRKLMLMGVRWLSRSRWGRRLIWTFVVRTVMARLRYMLRNVTEAFPVLESLLAWA